MRIERVGVDHRRHRIGRIVKAVDELETERHQQRDPQQYEGEDGGECTADKVGNQMIGRINKADGQGSQKNGGADRAWTLIQFCMHCGR